MRVVLDTNVLIAALIAHGTCHEVLEQCVHQHEIVASASLLRELHRVLVNKFGYSRREANEVERLLKPRMILVSPQPLDGPVCSDPDDDVILATAVAGDCRCLITGDKDLLKLQQFRGIDIITPEQFWRYE
ncbi:putative toxin-antitoxin system toxin component, PIN family [Nitrospiraceae bacterium AH_259_D15_M11_P09]|nr:putative toxin-antitoxin system toxin component, PIN family [Nitrospiraceae bacterium AH_259_D15_M11_P09]